MSLPQLSISKNLKLMGVINVTPDSFSDGGCFDNIDKAHSHALELIAQGVDILDIGGESTRPGSSAVSLEQELDRTIGLIEAIRQDSDITISIDTNKSAVMQAAVSAGASIINSVWALRLEDSLQVAAELNVPVCLMHMQGEPLNMQLKPDYTNVVEEVKSFLGQRIEVALKAGIHGDNIIIDPGFGFGKTLDQNLQLLKAIPVFTQLAVPVLVGMSRKNMIGKILDKPVDQRLFGSISAAVMAAMLGADIIRVHDVAQTMDALAIVRALGGVAS